MRPEVWAVMVACCTASMRPSTTFSCTVSCCSTRRVSNGTDALAWTKTPSPQPATTIRPVLNTVRFPCLLIGLSLL